MSKATQIWGVVLACALLLGAGTLAAQDWPQWRGPSRDNHVTGFAAPKTWPKALTQKWKVTVGVGESSPVLVGDRVYVIGRRGGDEVIACLDATSGKEVWKDSYAAPFKAVGDQAYPGPRSTPAVGEGKVCTLGVNGEVSCLDAATGKEVWRKKKAAPKFHTASSPIIVDGKCIVFAGALTAFDLTSGKEDWAWKGAPAGYGSPVLMTADGVKQVVTPAEGALAGVAFAGGKELWRVKLGTAWQNNYSTPVIAGQTVIYSETPGGGGKFGKKGGGAGLMAFKIEKKGDGFTATEVWRKPTAAAGYHTPVLKGDSLFGVNTGMNFFCMDVKTGDTLWTDTTRRGQAGSILAAGSVLLALTSDRNLVVMRPSRKAYEEVAKYEVAESWCVPIVAGNRIYVKDKGGSLTLWTID
jgi:outer membrane protein assembly factor BamB